MRAVILSFLLIFVCFLGFSQPGNDDCDGVFDLGILPACQTTVYTNVAATASSIGANNIPGCFSNGIVQADVWFSFTTSVSITSITLNVDGSSDGGNDAMVNPQVAVYRGSCGVDGLVEVACAAAALNSNGLSMDVLDLSPNITYFVRVDNHNAAAGDFTLCIEELSPTFNIGQAVGASTCSGTLYDTGGPDGDYVTNSDQSFTICPSAPHDCILLDVVSFDIEEEFDSLNFYAGDNVNDPLIASLQGGKTTGSSFKVVAPSGCVTVRLSSDESLTFEGFEIQWSCSTSACQVSDFDNPTTIASLPANLTNNSTCDAGATFNTSPCGDDLFLNGPEVVFAYDAPGGFCTEIRLANALPGTNLLVLDGRPGDANVNCVAVGDNGYVANADMKSAGRYYIVVANSQGCTDFDLQINETECLPTPALVDALCNPINNCLDPSLKSTIKFQNGFKDFTLTDDVNTGCWLGDGEEPDYFWFTVQSNADGKLGFVINFLGTLPSDVDYNIWGPFSDDEVCNSPDDVIDFITRNQPIRSSWSDPFATTGLADVHPITGNPVDDVFDCEDEEPGGSGDDFTKRIDTKKGEVYVVLLNDWGDRVSEEGIEIDWSLSDPGVITELPTFAALGDTAICAGDQAQLQLENVSNTINWIDETGTLSCTDCANPVASPTETTTYTAIVEKACGIDTVEVTVRVFELEAGPDVTVCLNEDFQRIAGEDYSNATYSWSAPGSITLSCTDCPNPVITAAIAGTHNISVTLTAENCTLQDNFSLTVLPTEAPQFSVAEDLEICAGTTVSLGETAVNGLTYSWSSVPAGFSSDESNPNATPTETTVYTVSVTNNSCALPSLDSVRVTVFQEPEISILSDTQICQGDELVLGTTTVEADVVYQWTGPSTIEDPTNANSSALPEFDGTYTLLATRGVCEVQESFSLTIIPIEINIEGDPVQSVCKDASIELTATVQPFDALATWTPADGLNMMTGNVVTTSPDSIITYTASVMNDFCVRTDTVRIVIDSLPLDLLIMPSDTTICEGSIVVLETPVFEPEDYPNIKFKWGPDDANMQSPDSLFNLVLSGDTTTMFFREVINGGCLDTTWANVFVDTIPDISITPTDTIICLGESVQIVVEVDADLEEEMWMPPEGLSCMDCLEPKATPFQSTSFQFSAMAGECPVSIGTDIEVLPAPFAFTDQTTICPGESVTLNTLVIPNTTYTWTSSADPNFSSTEPMLTVTPAQTTTYTLTVENLACGEIMDQITIQVAAPASVQIIPSKTFICPGETVTLTAETTGGTSNDQFIWSGAGIIGSSNGRSVSVRPQQNTNYSLTYVVGNNCETLTANVVIEVDPIVITEVFTTLPDSLLGAVPLGRTIDIIGQLTTAGNGPFTTTWEERNGAGTLNESGLSIRRTPTEDGLLTYVLTVTSPAGCVSSDSLSVQVLPAEYAVPTAFTPNGDGVNDFFKVFSSSPLTIKSFQVFNRWGQKCYDNENGANGWDGTHNGKPAVSDIYAYIIEVAIPIEGGGEIPLEPLKGEVALLR